MTATVTLGVYEKALAARPSWNDYFAQVKQAGFTFCDLSVDETPARFARLDWDADKREEVRLAAKHQGVQLGGICLSAHRKIMPGSRDASIRKQAKEVYRKGIDLAYDLGIHVVQVAGYFNYYEEHWDEARRYYVDALGEAGHFAAKRGILLGIENVDSNGLRSIPEALEVVEEISNPYVQLYPDIGNIAEHGGDEREELDAAKGRMLAVHVKDVLPGQPRKIPFGKGIVNWKKALSTLAAQNWSGRMMLEMWNEDDSDALGTCISSRTVVSTWLQDAGIEISLV